MDFLELDREGESPLFLFNVAILADGTIQANAYFTAQDISITDELYYENRIYYAVKPIKGDPLSPFSIGFPIEANRLENFIELETLTEPVSA